MTHLASAFTSVLRRTLRQHGAYWRAGAVALAIGSLLLVGSPLQVQAGGQNTKPSISTAT